MTRVTVPVSGGARIRIQKLVPQPLLRVLPVYSVTPQPGKLGAGGGSHQAAGAHVWEPGGLPFEIQFPTHCIPCDRKASVRWRLGNFVSEM